MNRTTMICNICISLLLRIFPPGTHTHYNCLTAITQTATSCRNCYRGLTVVQQLCDIPLLRTATNNYSHPALSRSNRTHRCTNTLRYLSLMFRIFRVGVVLSALCVCLSVCLSPSLPPPTHPAVIYSVNADSAVHRVRYASHSVGISCMVSLQLFLSE